MKTLLNEINRDVERARRNYAETLAGSAKVLVALEGFVEAEMPVTHYINFGEYGCSLQFYDGGAFRQLTESPENAEARALVAAFDKVVAQLLEMADETALVKQKSARDLYAQVRYTTYVDGADYDVEATFYWQGMAPPCKRYRVTQTWETSTCGEIDVSQYERVEEITD